MSEAKYIAARELVKEKHYDVARSVLLTMNEPRAREWLAKLENYPTVKPRSRNYIAWIITFIAVVVAAGSLMVAFKGATMPSAEVTTMMKAYCGMFKFPDETCKMVIFAEFSDSELMYCSDMAEQANDVNTLMTCLHRNDPTSTPDLQQTQLHEELATYQADFFHQQSDENQ